MESVVSHARRPDINPGFLSTPTRSAIRSSGVQSLSPHVPAKLSSQQRDRQILQNKLRTARESYEVALSPSQLWQHQQNQQRVAGAVATFKENYQKKNPGVLPDEIRLAIEKDIASIVKSAKFDPSCYRPKGTGVHEYGKYLIYTDDNQNAGFCFQFFRFDPEQKTPIHDHPCDCTSLVVEGQVRERMYQRSGLVLQKTKKEDRSPGSTRAIDLQRNDPHSIKNSSKDKPAGTLHVYRMDGVVNARAVRDIFDASTVHKVATPVVIDKDIPATFSQRV